MSKLAASGRLRLFSALRAIVFAAVLLPAALAATTVAINVDTQNAVSIAAGFSGFNAPQPRNGVEYYDPKFVNAAGPLKPGWIRFPGGTSSMAYDWNPNNPTGGHINIDWMNSLISGSAPPVTGQPASILVSSQQLTQAKGGVWLSDFAVFARKLGANAVICFNGFTDTNPNSAAAMAQAAQDEGLNVLEWEIDNEAYVYPQIFSNAGTYASAAYNPYYTQIQSVSPQTPIGLFMGTNTHFANWNDDLSAYSPRYWGAVSIHYYPITKVQNISTDMQTLNGILAHGTNEYIQSYVDPLIGANTPIYITEFNCCTIDNDQFLAFAYNGVFLAEYIARMSSVPNMRGVGVNSLYTDNYDFHGMLQSFDDHESYLLNQLAMNPNYSTNTATDPNTQFQFYTSAPGLAMQVANHAINNSDAIWTTTVTGGPMVPILGYDGQPIPAIFAQAYKATDGSHYVLITNKSGQTCTTTIQLNGSHVSGYMHVTTVSSATAAGVNTAQYPTNIQIKESSAINPITVGPFSVTVVHW